MPTNHPLLDLYRYATPFRHSALLASLYSALNKLFDVLPELLIGVAVDVVVNRRESFIARMGLPDPMQQLLVLVGLTVLIWALESLFEYLSAVRWRNLAQDLQHVLRQNSYQHSIVRA